MLRDDKWHCYAFTGVNLSSWPGLTTICYYGFNNGYQFRGMIADIKIYNTILSQADILAEYQRKAAIDKNGNLFTGEFVEQAGKATLPTKKGQVIADDFEEGVSKTRIFGGYTELSYIENTGETTISTGYIMDMDNDNVEITFQANIQSQYGMIFANTHTHYFWLYHYESTNRINVYIDNGSGQNNLGGPIYDTNIHTAVWHNKKYYVDDVYYGEQTRTLGSTSQQIFLFAYDAGGSYPYKGKIFRCKIWNNSGVQRDLIPAKRNKDNVIGMFDVANGKFYAPTGSGSFTAGPEVGELSIICANEVNEL